MNLITRILSFTINVVDRFNEWIGKSVAWLVCMMVLVTFLVVVLRYIFDWGWIAMQESVSYMHAIVFMLGIGYTLKQQGHVRVDVFYQRHSKKVRAWIDLLGTLTLLMPFCCFVVWSSWDYVEASWSIKESSREAGGLPGLYLIKTTIPIMAVLLMLQGLAEVLRSILTLVLDDPEVSGR